MTLRKCTLFFLLFFFVLMPGRAQQVPDVSRYQPLPLPEYHPPTGDKPSHPVKYNIRQQQEEAILEEIPASSFQEVAGRKPAAAPRAALDDTHLPTRDFTQLELVQNTGADPWIRTVKLFMEFPDGTQGVCSGSMIDSRHVLTAGHCVHLLEHGGWASSVFVFPGYQNGFAPVGGAQVIDVYSWTDWTQNENYDWDVAYLLLDRPVGTLSGWLGFAYNDNDAFYTGNNTFHNSSYPAQSPFDGEFMYYYQGNYDFLQGEVLYHYNQGYQGQSGSNTYFNDNGNRQVHAILSHGDPAIPTTGHVRLNETKFNAIVGQIGQNTPAQPDLVPLYTLIDPDVVQTGAELTGFQFLVHNYSSANFNGSFQAEVFLSTDRQADSQDISLGAVDYNGISLGPKASEFFSVNSGLVIPVSIPPGEYFLGVVLQVNDAETANNFSSAWDVAAITVGQGGTTFSVNPQTVNFGPGSDSQLISVSSGSNWTVTSSAGWLSFSQTTGAGNGTFTISCSANNGTGPRTATVAVNDGTLSQTISVAQQGASSSLSVSPASVSFGSGAEARTISVNGNVSWTASESVSWLSLNGGSGSNGGTFTLSCTANTGTNSRNALVTVSGGGLSRTVSVAQQGLSASLAVSPASVSFGSAADSRPITVNSNVNWTAAESAGWLSLSSSSGSGHGSFTLSCTENIQTTSRTAQVLVSGGGQSVSVSVTQEGQAVDFPWQASETGDNHTIIVPADFTSSINGLPLQNGDLIGFFYEDGGTLHCSNFVQWQGQGTSFAVFGNDPDSPAKNGFVTGEAFHVKAYLMASEEEVDLNAQFAPVGTAGLATHTGFYAKDGISMITNVVEAPATTTLEISLDAGWNMISSYVAPTEPGMLDVLADIGAEVILIKNGDGQSTIPSLDINGIGDWNLTEGYKVKMETGITLAITGQQADPAISPIPIEEGWQIISYLRDQPGDITGQLASIAGQLEIVKDNTGRAYIPSLGINNIGSMEPTQGYKVKASSATTLFYPGNSPQPLGALAGEGGTATVHFVLDSNFNTGNNATLAFLGEALQGIASPGDEAGIFNEEGTLCGAVVVTAENFAATAWGDDPSTSEKEGMAVGEAYQLRIWNAAVGEEHDLAAGYQLGDGLYEIDDLEIINELDIVDVSALQSRAAGMQRLKVFPNPTTGKLWVEIPAGLRELMLYDAQGQPLRRIKPEQQVQPASLGDLPPGLYFLRGQAKESLWGARIIRQ